MSEIDSSDVAPRRSVPLWVQVIVFVGLIGLLGAVALTLNKAQHGSVKVGETIPDFNLKFYDGYKLDGRDNVSLAALKGKVVVVNFWASWCKPCEQEAPFLQSAWKYYEPGGKVVFLGVDYVDTETDARVYLKKFAISYPNGPDLQSSISDLFRITGVPETYVIDRNGVLVQSLISPFASEDEIHSMIDPLLK